MEKQEWLFLYHHKNPNTGEKAFIIPLMNL